VVVLANKADMPHASPEEVAQALGLATITGRQIKVFETVANTGGGLQDAMSWLVQNLRNV